MSTSSGAPIRVAVNPLQTFAVTISPSIILGIIVILVFFVWLLFTIIIAYHWLRYSHRSRLGIPLFATHIVVSFILFLMGLSGFI